MAPVRRKDFPRQFRPARQTRREERPWPSRGGSRGYDIVVRHQALQEYRSGLHNHPLFQQHAENLRANGKPKPSLRTVQRYDKRERELGHCQAFVMQGNAPSQGINGHLIIALALFRLAFPYATTYEVIAFLWNAQPDDGNQKLFSLKQVLEAEDLLGLSRKRGSVTAFQAKLPRNILKREIFWNVDFPAGIVGINRADLIDIDETGLFIESSTRTHGKAMIGRRVREVGPYGHSTKFTLIMAITGCDQDDNIPKKFYELERRNGTSFIDFVRFITSILDVIGPGTAARRRTFLMDNLASHRNPWIRMLIENRGHRLLYRPPYYPEDGPIEYVFNNIETQLKAHFYNIRDEETFRAAMQTILHGMHNFVNFFTHCGYE
jgi:hypothetical protein